MREIIYARPSANSCVRKQMKKKKKKHCSTNESGTCRDNRKQEV